MSIWSGVHIQLYYPGHCDAYEMPDPAPGDRQPSLSTMMRSLNPRDAEETATSLINQVSHLPSTFTLSTVDKAGGAFN